MKMWRSAHELVYGLDCGQACERIGQLERENAELREERRMWLDGWAVNRIAELESLVRDMRKLLRLSAETPATVSSCDLIDERMKELGLLDGEEGASDGR